MAELIPPQSDLEEDEEQGTSGRTIEAVAVVPVETLSAATTAVLRAANELAVSRGNESVTADDLFAALVTTPCAASNLLVEIKMTGEMLAEQLAFILGRGSADPATVDPVISPRLIRVLDTARLEAGRREATEISTLHLMTALLRERSGVACLLLETPGLGLEPIGAVLNRALREGMSDIS